MLYFENSLVGANKLTLIYILQRRRWSPSTLANILDLLADWRKVTNKNETVSIFYIAYQVNHVKTM